MPTRGDRPLTPGWTTYQQVGVALRSPSVRCRPIAPWPDRDIRPPQRHEQSSALTSNLSGIPTSWPATASSSASRPNLPPWG